MSQIHCRVHKHCVTSVAVSGDGKLIFSGSWNGTVRKWDGKIGEAVEGPLREHEDREKLLASSDDGKFIVLGPMVMQFLFEILNMVSENIALTVFSMEHKKK